MRDHVCPTCGKECASYRGMKVHHSKAHGESIAGEVVECDHCGDEFRKRLDRVERDAKQFCSRDCQAQWRANNLPGGHNYLRKGDEGQYEQIYREYLVEGKNMEEIADGMDITSRTVNDRINELGIRGKQPAKFELEPAWDGYPKWTALGPESPGRFRVHRLIAIANGADPYKVFSFEYATHHRNKHKIDNRPDNIEVLPKDVHDFTHHNEEWTTENGWPVLVPVEPPKS